MTTYADAEAARQRAIAALREAGLAAEVERLAALPPIVDRETAAAVIDAAYAAYEPADRAGLADRAARLAATATAEAWRAAIREAERRRPLSPPRAR